MPDQDGYPTEEELKRLKEWDRKDVRGFLDFLESIWWTADWGFVLSGKRKKILDLHTGGWSGNEEIISVLRETFFWCLYWQSSRRGGHYTFSGFKL